MIALTALTFLAVLAGNAFALEPKRAGQESFLTRAVFAEGRLWLLSDAGELSSIAEGKHAQAEEVLPEPALDLCLRDRRPAVITCKRKGCTDWTLRQWTNGKWLVQAKVPAQNDELLALSCDGARVTLLTTRRIIDLVGDKHSTLVLSEPLRTGLVTSVHVTPERLFVGLNAGEWGGGLRRIDRKSGKITKVERNATGELCAGPLNSRCDPVNGIAAEPWKPDCVALAVGLVHFEPRGRIVEVCGDSVQQLYSKRYAVEDSSDQTAGTSDERFPTVAFFGLTRQGDALWAAGIDGIYRIDAAGVAQSTPLPVFEEIGGIRVSFDSPHFVLVRTSVNQRRSISGSVPMIVPRDY